MKHLAQAFIAACLLCLSSCSSPTDHSGGDPFTYSEVKQHLTCVSASPDSTCLLLGSVHPSFSIYYPETDLYETYPLPQFTDKWKTYDILPLSPDEFLVAKQNCGVLYVRYAGGKDGRRYIAHLSRIKAAARPLPDKGVHYSAYSLLMADSTLVIGSSNGLKYLDGGDMQRLRRDTMVQARFATPLAHLRKGRTQFSQEAMFISGDSLLTVTDRGIYRVAIAALGSGNTELTVFDPAMRCWDAALDKDSLTVLWSPDDNSDKRLITRFSLSGKRGSTAHIESSVSWVGLYGDSIRYFSKEGTFQCFHAATMLGRDFYYIRDGKLMKSTPGVPGVDSDEYLVFADNGYGLSNRLGLWHTDTENSIPVFLGNLKGISGIRDISVYDEKMYLAVANGVYVVSLANHLLAHDREASLIEPNSHRKSDRMESILAVRDTLLIGSRNGLYYYIPGTGERHRYRFEKLDSLFESPYIRQIVPNAKGGFLVQTMNFGVWHLPSLTSGGLFPTSGDGIPAPDCPPMRLNRPGIDWGTIAENILLITAGILIITGLAAVVLAVIQKRHRTRIRILNLAVSKEHRSFIAEKEKSVRQLAELADRQEELCLQRTRFRETIERQQKEFDKEREEKSRQLGEYAAKNEKLVKKSEELQLTLQRLQSEFEKEKDAAAKKMHAPMANVAIAIKQALGIIGNGAGAGLLAECLGPIQEYLEADSDDITLADKAISAYRKICNHCAARISSHEKLTELTPDSGPLRNPLLQYKEENEKFGNIAHRTLASQLEWMAENHKMLERLYSRTYESVAQFCSERGRKMPLFTREELSEIWDECIFPAINGNKTRQTLPKLPLGKVTDISLTERAWVCAAVTFYGCLNPEIEGHHFIYDTSTITRFENTDRHGTVYKLWADLISDSLLLDLKADTMAASIADLLWKAWLSRPHPGEASSGFSRLYLGTRFAFEKRNKTKISGDIEEYLKDRPARGRPRTRKS